MPADSRLRAIREALERIVRGAPAERSGVIVDGTEGNAIHARTALTALGEED